MDSTQSIANEIIIERRRQVTKEHFSRDHDDRHTDGEIALAAACYASSSRIFVAEEVAGRGYETFTQYRDAWPWADMWWKPKGRRSDLVRAAALVVAEIERLDRAQAKQP